MNWIARIFVAAMTRRIAIALTVVLLSCVGISGKAHAGLDGTRCGSNGATQYGCDQGMALADCNAQLSALKAKFPSAAVTYPCDLSSGNANGGAYRCEVRDAIGPRYCGATGQAPFYNFSGSCSARESYYQGLDNNLNITRVCNAGCEMKLEPVEKYTVSSPFTDPTEGSRGTMKPSGNTCTSPRIPPRKPPPGQFCHETLGGHTVCVRDDGKTCVISGTTGRTYCAPNGSPMNATNPDRTENASIGPPSPPGSPTPPTPPTPREGENWKPSASATVTNNTSNNSNSITINGNAGTPNNNAGQGNPNDGSGNPGTPGGGNGQNGNGEESGSAGSGIGKLYDKQPMTPTEAVGAYATAALQTPIIQSVQAFFGNCAYSGSCPTWTYDGGEMMGTQTFDALCSGAFNDLLVFAGYIVMATAAFAAFKIAFY